MKETLQNITNSTVYLKVLHRLTLSCPKCGLNRGCNKNPKWIRSWKKFRKTQYKIN